MTNSIQPTGDNGLPAPLQFLAGLLQWMLGAALAMLGGVLRAFAVTAPIGAPLFKAGYKLCYNGGADMGTGLVGIFRLIGKGLSAGVRAGANMAAQHQAKKDKSPVE